MGDKKKEDNTVGVFVDDGSLFGAVGCSKGCGYAVSQAGGQVAVALIRGHEASCQGPKTTKR